MRLGPAYVASTGPGHAKERHRRNRVARKGRFPKSSGKRPIGAQETDQPPALEGNGHLQGIFEQGAAQPWTQSCLVCPPHASRPRIGRYIDPRAGAGVGSGARFQEGFTN